VRRAVTYLAAALMVGAAAPAAAQPAEPPLTPRIFHVPTAWMQPPAHVYTSAGANHRGGFMLSSATGLGQLAELEAELTDRFVDCTTVCEGDDRAPGNRTMLSALFKIGVAERRWAPWQPALALGFRRTVAGNDEAAGGDASELGMAELYAAASMRRGSLQAHLGAELWDAASPGARLSRTPRLYVRPFVGLGWRPPQYPKTTLMGDFSYVPELPIADTEEPLRWLAGWGIRYQALSWGSIELAVRHREGESIGGATVFVRVNASVGLFSRRR
jgi:hypothetical protein